VRRTFLPVDLSIKNVPDDLADLLRARAKRNHRSLQGELMAIIEGAASAERTTEALRAGTERLKRLGLSTPDEATAWIREDRDAR
jgi:plasmid stability protein